jgi:hypothetical protein
MDYTNMPPQGSGTHGRNSPHLGGGFSDGPFSSNGGYRAGGGQPFTTYAGGLMKKINAGKLLRTAALSNPISPERIAKADNKFD